MIGPIGNAIYVNQQMASVASEKNALLNRFDLQNVAAQTIVNEKEKEILEVRPAEENHAVDPDREHQRQEAQEELDEEAKEKELAANDDKNPSTPALHQLDIKV